ncbi:MAG: hypothetical protein GY810_29015 [Aureispira sp.]|nr:hypothetical protein [Aureispira sp.]
MKTWEEKLAFYDKLIEANPNFKRKGKTVPCTTANGHMFSQLNKAGEIGIRLPKEAGEKFMEEYSSTRFKSYGSFMRGYVLIPESLYSNTELLGKLLQKGYEYVMSLESK